MKLEDVLDWKLLWQETKVVGISRQPSPVQNMIDQKTGGECGIFQVFG